MDAVVPLQLGQLLRAPDCATRAAAWNELIADHTRLLLAVARSFGGAHDETMDRYSYILGELLDGNFRHCRNSVCSFFVRTPPLTLERLGSKEEPQ